MKWLGRTVPLLGLMVVVAFVAATFALPLLFALLARAGVVGG